MKGIAPMLTALIASMILAQAPGPVTADLLPFDPAKLGRLEKVEVKVTEDGQAVTYSGVALATILESRVKNAGSMANLRSLSDAVLLVRGSDGYQAAISASAAAMDPKGERFLLAISRNGKSLLEGQGPVRLIVPGDPKHARWVKDVVAIRLVRLDRLVGP
jgi:DMSO/TMAO reductase YedYZ molybdopterin-dependent catalytic subunit